MINITEYFKENVKRNNYYNYHFFNIVYNETIIDYTFYDDKVLILELKKFLKRKITEEITYRDEIRFILISFYLQDSGYYIEQFPEYLERPYRKAALPELLFNKMDSYLENINIKNKKELNKEKSKLIDNLTFIRKNYNISDDIEEIFNNISARNAKFNSMSEDEKLKEICNGIEFLLKEKDKFKEYQYNRHINIINNEKIMDFRKKLECFRHSSKESIIERGQYDSFEKDLMIRYGIFIIETIKKKKDLMR